MKKNLIFLLLFLMCSILVTTEGLSREQEFLHELCLFLQAYGWEKEEIDLFMYAAQDMNWDDIETEHGEIVAYSLHYCQQHAGEINHMEKASIAHHLAITGSEMKALGFDENMINRVAVNAVRDIIHSLPQYRKKDGEKAMGDMIQQQIQEQLRGQGINEQQDQLMQGIRESIQQKKREKGNSQDGGGGGSGGGGGGGHGHGPSD
jgi:hypothetical protein